MQLSTTAKLVIIASTTSRVVTVQVILVCAILVMGELRSKSVIAECHETLADEYGLEE